jgi:hypothetical protein
MKRKLRPHTTQRLSRAERLRVLVAFAQQNLSALRPGDWLNLKDDVQQALLGAIYGPQWDMGTDEIPIPDGFMVHIVDPRWPGAFPPEELVQVQAEVRTRLEAVLSCALLPLVPLQVAAKLECCAGQWVLIVEGTLRDGVLWLLLHLLLEGAASLLRCPECGTLFVPQRNQDYCSRHCTNQVSQRLWRQRREPVTA